MKHTEAQLERIKNHEATVLVDNISGNLEFTTESIITPFGSSKLNKVAKVKVDEEPVLLSDHVALFEDLHQINVILTNACNLSCTYCYEQHNEDFGHFTVESLHKVYRFLADIRGTQQTKNFQLFGGEPLIHKQLILSFLEAYKDEIAEESKKDFATAISICTNGILLTEDFIKKYFEYEGTSLVISLDTTEAEIDHRQIGQEALDELLKKVSYIPTEVKEQHRVVIRTTLAEEHLPFLLGFVEDLYARGVRQFVVHPLVLDSGRGFIQWSKDTWAALYEDMTTILDKYDDLILQFSEGVGKKKENNCLVGSDMLAIDGSGDISGCHFFTNLKNNGASIAILGNILDNTFYKERHTGFHDAYNEMFEKEEQCMACDYKNLCYQCPAGNLDVDGTLFRPDDMCQNIVKLYIQLHEDMSRKQFNAKLKKITEAVGSEGDEALTKGMSYLLFYYMYKYHPTTAQVHEGLKLNSNELVGIWKSVIDKELDRPEVENFVEFLNTHADSSNVGEISEIYYLGSPTAPNQETVSDDEYSRIFYLTLLHFITLVPTATSFTNNFNYET